jgi:hypothetical protein
VNNINLKKYSVQKVDESGPQCEPAIVNLNEAIEKLPKNQQNVFLNSLGENGRTLFSEFDFFVKNGVEWYKRAGWDVAIKTDEIHDILNKLESSMDCEESN